MPVARVQLHPTRSIQLAAENKTTSPVMSPGDQAPPGTPGTGDNICPECSRRGRLHGTRCERCGGTGTVIEGVGGA
jgi:hypothetical protein